MVVQLIVTKPCLDTSKWWINGPSKTIWMDLNSTSTACYQHCSNGTRPITICVQNQQWAFLKKMCKVWMVSNSLSLSVLLSVSVSVGMVN